MNKKFISIFVLAVSISTAGLSTASAFADAPSEPDKPIDYMTPSDLFMDAQLRELAVAAQHGDVEKIDALVSKGVDVNGKGKYGITPLFSAVQAGNKTGYKALLDHGADPNTVWTTGHTLMNLIASSSPDPYFMQLALEHGGNPSLVEPWTGKTPLLAAVTVTGKVNIPLLIKAGSNLNQQRPIGRQSAIMEAVDDFGQFDVVYELLTAGADYKLIDAGERDIRDYVRSSFDDNVSPEEKIWRDRVIEFLKQHDYWERISWPTKLSVNNRILNPGDLYVLSWYRVDHATSYDLRLNGDTNQTGITTTNVQKTAPNRQQTIDGDLIWSVRACSDDGCSAWSPSITVDIKPNNQ